MSTAARHIPPHQREIWDCKNMTARKLLLGENLEKYRDHSYNRKTESRARMQEMVNLKKESMKFKKENTNFFIGYVTYDDITKGVPLRKIEF